MTETSNSHILLSVASKPKCKNTIHGNCGAKEKNHIAKVIET